MNLIISIKFDSSRFKFRDTHKRLSLVPRPDAILRIYCDDLPNYSIKDNIFDSSNHWVICSGSDKHISYICPPSQYFSSYKLVNLDPNSRSGDIYIKDNKCDQACYFYPLEYLLDELLMINLLISFELGVMLHASGVNDNGHGILFVGSSGSGKSTLANIWKKRNGMSILNDDKIIIRKIKNRFWMFSSHWHESQVSVPLEKIFFIKHGKKNIFLHKSGVEAVTTLLAQSFPPFWNRSRIHYILQLFSELSKEVPCYELRFVPNESVVDFVREV